MPLSPNRETPEHSRDRIEEAMARRSTRKRWLSPVLWLGTVVAVVGLIVGVLFGVLLQSDSLGAGTADPGGSILHSLIRSIAEDTPTNARVVRHHYQEPRWRNCERGRPSGFTDVRAEVEVTSSMAPAMVAAIVSRLMTAHGWQGDSSSWTGSFTDFQPSGAYIIGEDATLHGVANAGSTVWRLTMSATSFGYTQGFCSGPSF